MTPLAETKQIIAKVALETRVPVYVIIGKQRTASAVSARWKAIRLVHEAKPHLSTPELGRIFNMHHTSILHALGRLNK